ncbi:MAG: 50S ribosomal protein L10 [Clostridia bacterium]|nr:50S ribosomal protein L10 [Clostridia bacterium]
MPSKKILQVKEAEVSAIAEELKGATTVVLVDARGITVDQDTEMRVALRKAGVKYKVRKNTLTSLAAKQAGIEGLDKYLVGPTAVATTSSYSDAARILSQMSKKFGKLTIKGGVLDNEVVGPEVVDTLAKIPSKEVLISMVLGGFNAPITKLAVALNAIAEKKAEAEAQA